MADTPTGETVAQESLKNNAQDVSTPPVVNADDSAVERLQKQLEQERMEKNMLRNKLEAEEKAKAAAEAKQLEEKQEYKTLYEQEREKREESERLRESTEKEIALKSKSEEVLAEYTPEVKELAKDLNVGLDDITDDSVVEFKKKLDSVQAKISVSSVSPNNPAPKAQPKASIANADGIIEAPLQDNRFDELAKSMPGISSMMTKTDE